MSNNQYLSDYVYLAETSRVGRILVSDIYLILHENVEFTNTPNLNYEERAVPRQPPKSVVRGKTRVPDQITNKQNSGCVACPLGTA